MSQKPQDYRLTGLLTDPSAVPGCADCLSLSVSRENARSRSDYSAVSDANVELRQHQAETHAS